MAGILHLLTMFTVLLASVIKTTKKKFNAETAIMAGHRHRCYNERNQKLTANLSLA